MKKKLAQKQENQYYDEKNILMLASKYDKILKDSKSKYFLSLKDDSFTKW